MNTEGSSTAASSPSALPCGSAFDPRTLPDDVAVLQAMIRELFQALQKEQHRREGLQQRIDVLLRRLYGPKAERFDPNQP